MQISQSNYTIMKIIMIPISDFQEVIFLDLETLPKLVFAIFGTFANFTDQLCILTNFGFLPRTLESQNYKAYPTK